ncbi:TPA: fimbrial protein [Escherichia coli]|uniref:Fimbrial protein n=1 Tax=Escherichia coli TaxID=562 RepID=A0A6G6AJE2_ECOLX|nr:MULTISPECIES: fimbrial protein [Enterobacteriaceae]EBY4184599.1 type 1 fimbrial protein [Salmonella enterica subsp. enterica serovar Saintpaul]HCC7246631.1 type 1 fimbrial protein [Escherichia coli O141:H32]EFC2195446.1 type 1 fimbrial protein [Escherichia coli]EFI7022245.1 type 1 fimbrial protein [Escherichia coli]EFN7961445.1 type 1 fimbrial protein [Escherichia coli]
MKGYLLIRAVPLLLLLGLSAPLAQAADATITVNGRVVAKPCTVSTKNVKIDFGTLYAYSFINAQSTSQWKSFDLQLTNCPVGTSQIVASFSGTPTNTDYYANQATQDAATNIQIELQDTAGALLKNGSNKKVTVNDNDKSVTIPLQVRLVSLTGGATQGTVQSVITVTYQYQ